MTFGEKVSGIVGWLADSLAPGRDYYDEDAFTGFEEDCGYDGNAVRKPEVYQTKVSKSNESNVTKLNGYKGHEVRIIDPRSFGDTTQIVQQLLDNKTVILNLHLLDKEQMQRTIDFVCGANYALGGAVKQVGDTVFIFTPNTVQLSVEQDKTSAFGTDGLWGGNL